MSYVVFNWLALQPLIQVVGYTIGYLVSAGLLLVLSEIVNSRKLREICRNVTKSYKGNMYAVKYFIIFESGYILGIMVHNPELALARLHVRIHLALLFVLFISLLNLRSAANQRSRETYYVRILFVANLLLKYPLGLVGFAQNLGCVIMFIGVIGLLLALSETERSSAFWNKHASKPGFDKKYRIGIEVIIWIIILRGLLCMDVSLVTNPERSLLIGIGKWLARVIMCLVIILWALDAW